MNAILLTLAVAVLGADQTPGTSRVRKRPAVEPAGGPRELTKEEEDKLDDLVDRVIQADTGRLSASEAKKVLKEFNALNVDALPALIRGVNKAAKMEHSCPVLVISKKLDSLLLKTTDPKMLEFARDEIGAGVGRTRHAGVLQNLRVRAMLRKNALARQKPPAPRGPRSLSTGELVKAAGTVRGPRLKALLVELEKRPGKEALGGLAVAAASYDRETQKLLPTPGLNSRDDDFDPCVIVLPPPK